MSNVVLTMSTTMNGRLDDPFDWFVGIDEDIYAEIDRMYDSVDAILVGRVTYEEMVVYWPGAETAEGGTDIKEINKSMARKMNSYKKFVFSRSGEKKTLEWNNAEQVIARSDEDVVQFVNGLKAQSGGDILLSGGAQLAQAMIRLGLVDEYRFFVHPVVSAGATWFDQIEDQRGMDLIRATTYDNGVVGLYYKPKSAFDTSSPESFSDYLS